MLQKRYKPIKLELHRSKQITISYCLRWSCWCWCAGFSTRQPHITQFEYNFAIVFTIVWDELYRRIHKLTQLRELEKLNGKDKEKDKKKIALHESSIAQSNVCISFMCLCVYVQHHQNRQYRGTKIILYHFHLHENLCIRYSMDHPTSYSYVSNMFHLSIYFLYFFVIFSLSMAWLLPLIKLFLIIFFYRCIVYLVCV